MEAKELRLGNYVKLSKDYQYVGITIPSGTIFKVESIETNSLYLKCNIKDGTFYGKIPVSMVDYIPLTEGLILECGFSVELCEFQIKEQRLLSIEDFWILYNSRTNFYGVMRSNEVFKQIEYLHQLQNIYLDLAGKELEISYEYQRGEMSLS